MSNPNRHNRRIAIPAAVLTASATFLISACAGSAESSPGTSSEESSPGASTRVVSLYDEYQRFQGAGDLGEYSVPTAYSDGKLTVHLASAALQASATYIVSCDNNTLVVTAPALEIPSSTGTDSYPAVSWEQPGDPVCDGDHSITPADGALERTDIQVPQR